MGKAGCRPDYIGVHQGRYQAIKARQLLGWSSPEEVSGMLKQIGQALALPGSPTQGELLELGCGDGCLAVELARNSAFKIQGIDIVDTAIELASDRAKREQVAASFCQGNVLALPFSSSSFDLLVDGHCLHCIVLDDRKVLFSEAKRVLRPGGMLVVLTMVGDPPPGMPGEFQLDTRTQVYGGVAGRHFGTVESILGEVRDAGFHIAEHWLWPARNASECDDLVVAALK